jgi:hypothetical protein
MSQSIEALIESNKKNEELKRTFELEALRTGKLGYRAKEKDMVLEFIIPYRHSNRSFWQLSSLSNIYLCSLVL